MKSTTLATNRKSGRTVDKVRELPSDPTVDWLWEELPETYWDPNDDPLNEEWDIAIKNRHVPKVPTISKSIN